MDLDNTDKNSIDDFDLGSLEKILLKTKNDEAILEVESEINELDKLSKRLTSHANVLLDGLEGDDPNKPQRMNVKQPKKVSPVYVASQVSNIASLKTIKLNLLKHKNDLVSGSLDRALKVLAQIDKNKGEGGSELPYEQILHILVSSGITLPTNPNMDQTKSILDAEYTEKDIDAELMSIIEENNIPSLLLENRNSNEVVETNDIEENLAVKILIEVDENDEIVSIYKVDQDDTVLEEIDSIDDLDIIETDDGEFYCNINNLPVEEVLVD
ncbi:MAG: hypothetical protein [Bacteriophage sp.]|nr:MAG: hypothetical protein [Bacteriophage sp.]